ncbi:MAG TPA: phosphoribosylanthranilate isomerase [Candidatus Acidoferrales bacterium]|jgi:phosphoribosylanthranilate isomerase|nr:phosphoribosylanthranilate isomerase [Candidatus Acidoferrales bacterium]
MTWIKFCGCTSLADAEMAVEAGADAVGMILAPSPRRVGIDVAREIAGGMPAGVEAVAVVVNPSPDELDALLAACPNLTIQFSGSERPELVARFGDRAIKAIHVDARGGTERLEAACELYPQARVLFDTYGDGLSGGTGQTFAWERVAEFARKRNVVIAGGLNPANVDACIRAARPFGVDVRTGIESGGHKDAEKMRAFFSAVRAADAA